MSHLECKGPVLAIADVKGSTAAMLTYAQQHPEQKEFIVATEAGILHEMQRTCPDRLFYPVPPEVSEGSVGCHCNECEYMKMNTLLKVYNTLKYGWPSIEIDPELQQQALRPIAKMLELS
jgi:quinolinate synthase